jgi:ElaB/YqjD/DUF883 family membrane-anchored ribosome-binding protein
MVWLHMSRSAGRTVQLYMANQERSSASKQFDKASGSIEHDLQAMRDDVTRLAQQVAALLSAAGSEALRDVKAHLNRAEQGLDAGDSGSEAVDAVRDTAATAVGALKDIVSKRPFATFAIAIGLGFLFGATWRR